MGVGNAWIARFSLSNQAIRRGLIILTSYSYIGWIVSPCPTFFPTTYKDLKQGSNMIASVLWTFYESKLCFSKQEERFDHLSNFMLHFKKKLEKLQIKFIKFLDPSFLCFTTRKYSVSHVVSCWCHVRCDRLLVKVDACLILIKILKLLSRYFIIYLE